MKVWWLVLGGCWLVAPLSAQDDDRRAVLAVVQQLFDGMREKDTTRMRAALHPEARLVTTGVRDGVPVVGLVSPTQWLSGIPNAGAPVLDERLRNPVVHVDMGLASVWVEYTFYLGERLSHCGVDLFHLIKTAEGWRIIDLADTRRREGCPP
jgi:hypothetical protein